MSFSFARPQPPSVILGIFSRYLGVLLLLMVLLLFTIGPWNNYFVTPAMPSVADEGYCNYFELIPPRKQVGFELLSCALIPNFTSSSITYFGNHGNQLFTFE